MAGDILQMVMILLSMILKCLKCLILFEMLQLLTSEQKICFDLACQKSDIWISHNNSFGYFLQTLTTDWALTLTVLLFHVYVYVRDTGVDYCPRALVSFWALIQRSFKLKRPEGTCEGKVLKKHQHYNYTGQYNW